MKGNRVPQFIVTYPAIHMGRRRGSCSQTISSPRVYTYLPNVKQEEHVYITYIETNGQRVHDIAPACLTASVRDQQNVTQAQMTDTVVNMSY